MKQTPTTGIQHLQMDDPDTSTFNPTDDICSQLMQRYSKSSAPQHRHLIATAAAIKSLLQEEDSSLPLSPLSYFDAAMSALSTPHQNDASSSSALSTLLSIVLPLVPEGSISEEKAAAAVDVLVRVLRSEETAGSTSGAKCVVKCLGVLLGFCDLSDWSSVQLPFETLLQWSIDKRPKVRRCALVYLENALKSFQSRSVMKEASKLILSLLESNMSAAMKLRGLRNADGPVSERQQEAEQSDVVHVLSVVRVALPYLSDKVSVKVVSKLVKLLDAQFSAITRLILNAIEAFLGEVEVEIVIQVVEDIIGALSSYVSLRTNPEDSVISAATLLKIALDKVHAGDPGKWNNCLSLGVDAIAGLLTRDDDLASKSSHILKNLIDHQLSVIESMPSKEEARKDVESNAITSICSIFMSILDSFDGVPNKHTLAVLSVLFLKLGRNSCLYMRNIVLKLADTFTHAAGDESVTCHLQKCFGCAVIAMGAENVLSVVPISFSVENSTCSNMWLLPILKKYNFGSSLSYFMEHIVPVAESLQRAYRKVKKSVIGQDLQAHAHGLWSLLPTFCRHPTDMSKSFQSFAKVMLLRLKKDVSMHADIADALKELVKQNKCLPESGVATVGPTDDSSDFPLEDYLLEKRRLLCYSAKVANRNIKALSLYSHELLQALMIIFLDSPPEKRSSLKKAISCLASISESSLTKKIFILSLGRFPLVKADPESGELDLSNTSLNDTPSSISDESQWSLILDLASSVMEGADKDLVGLIFKLTKHALQTEDGIGVTEAYYTLSCILEEHPWFCSSSMDELVDLIIGLKSPADVDSLRNRLSCLRILLVHALKSDSDVENTKPFLIMNNIVLALKDSKEECRKIAYDVLLNISSCLGGSSAANPDGPYSRLISMILGYLSGPSPHITSAAVSALSVLVFKEPELCVNILDVIPSVTSLLQTKAIEVIKAVLGFIKVLVSCLDAKDLQNSVSIIMDGVLPWSSVSRHHFRSKVTVILEIMIRKCGFPAVKLVTPERYHSFVRKVSQSRHGKTASKEADSTDANSKVAEISIHGPKKRLRDEASEREDGSRLQKRRLLKQDPRSPGGNGTIVDFDKKTSRFNNKRSGIGHASGKTSHFNNKRSGIGHASGKTSHFNDKRSGIGHAPGKTSRFNNKRSEIGQASGKFTTRKQESFGKASSRPRNNYGPKNSRNVRSGR